MADIAVLQAPNARASKTIELLGREFQALTFSATPDKAAQSLPTTQPIGLVASAAAARQALTLAAVQPDAVNAVVLLAPSALDPTNDKDLIAKLAGMKAPTLLLLGTRDAAAQASARSHRQAIPGCHVTFVYDAGSDLENERPEAAAAAVSEFVRLRERYLVGSKSAKLFP